MKSEVKENRNKHLCEKNIILLHMRTANSQSSWRIYTLIRTFPVLRYTMYSSVSCKRATKVPIRLTNIHIRPSYAIRPFLFRFKDIMYFSKMFYILSRLSLLRMVNHTAHSY